MADTRKTLTLLQADLATTGAGGIDAAKLRHFLLSSSVPRACCRISSATATGAMTAGAWQKAPGTTTSTLLVDFTMPANNRLTYGGNASPMEFMVDISGDLTGTSGDEIQFGIDDTAAGAPAAETIIQLTLTGNTDHFSLSTRMNLSAADYAEVWINNTANTNTLTINRMQFRMYGIIS